MNGYRNVMLTLVPLVGLVVCLAGGAANAGTISNVSDASQVCPPTADPCLVVDKIEINSGAVLDFGTRTIHLQGGGQFDFQSNSAQVLTGDLIADSWGGGSRIHVRKNPGGGMVGGAATIVSRGSCSGDSSMPCQQDATCAAASAGTCTAASGSVVLNDDVRGDGEPAADVSLVAYGDFSSSGVFNLTNGGQSPGDVDGGNLEISSITGAVTIGGRIDLNGGPDAQGGSAVIRAATDITINEWIDGTGGDGGGGSVTLIAGRDVAINDDIIARADVGSGIGGDVLVRAGRDIILTGTSSTNNTVIDAKGHAAGEETGSGGSLSFEADGDVTIGQHVRLRADAAAADSDGGTISINGCDIAIDGTAKLEANGFSGGQIEVVGRGLVTVGSSSVVEAVADVDGEVGEIAFTVREMGTCSNDPTIPCQENLDCSVGCGSGQCQTPNPDTGGGVAQFDPAPEFSQNEQLADCN